jgi:2-polyprenyl-6-methoxyphenol hydroxylase-like FAD-dependent oxidoreductase
VHVRAVEPGVGRTGERSRSTRCLNAPLAASQVLIVGAGPTGLVLAIWLTRLGIGVRIIDKADGPGVTSRALGVQARTLELYRQVGLADAVVSGGVETPGLNFWVRGARAARVPLRRLGEGLTPFPYLLMYPQDAHERLLIERLALLGVQVERGTQLVSFEELRDSVRATLEASDGSRQNCEVAFVAGCDGAHSAVRHTLGVDFPGGAYSRIFYVADVEANGPAINGELHIDLDEADLLAIFPMQGQGRVRLLGTVREVAPEEMPQLTFDDVSQRAIQHLRLSVTHVNWFSTYRVHHRVAHSFRKGRAFLIGDAAHLHSPVGGQGMNTGIGDAINLSWKLAAVLRGRANDPLLDTYETERIAFARRLVATTDRVFTLAMQSGPLAEAARSQLMPRLAPALFRVGQFRRFAFHTISQIGIQYRHSPLSVGAAGPVHGGDRLPWVSLGPNEDNFGPLTSLGWQVHVYGEPSPAVADTCAGLDLPLHVFTWRESMRAAGLRRGAIYLIRPDTYFALANAEGDARELEKYFASRGLAAH